MTDRTVSFRILSDGATIPEPPALAPQPDMHWRDGYFDEDKPSSSSSTTTTTDVYTTNHAHFANLGDKAIRHNLWTTKARLDSIPEKLYYLARNDTFPLAVGGSQGAHTFANRAGHKLNEVMEITGIWNNFVKGAGQRPADVTPSAGALTTSTAAEGAAEDDAPVATTTVTPLPRKGGSNRFNTSGRTAFIDLCGGPGSFAQAIIGAYPRRSKVKLVGFGMTLKDPNMADKHNTAADGWYPNLVANKDFHPTFGVNGEGDIYKMSNIHAMVSTTEGMPMLLAVADGGFEVPSADANYQETISMRLAFCQWHSALCVLQKGGSFVLKLFDTFSPIMRSMLYLTTKFFESTFIVKPKHSRAVNSERYLAAKGFKGMLSHSWKQYLQRLHEAAFNDNSMPASLIPAEWMGEAADKAFEPSVVAMNTAIATNQIEAIDKVINNEIIQRFVRGETDATGKSLVAAAAAEEVAAGEKRPRDEAPDADPRKADATAAEPEEEGFASFE